jgi:hypothetical protein
MTEDTEGQVTWIKIELTEAESAAINAAAEGDYTHAGDKHQCRQKDDGTLYLVIKGAELVVRAPKAAS